MGARVAARGHRRDGTQAIEALPVETNSIFVAVAVAARPPNGHLGDGARVAVFVDAAVVTHLTNPWVDPGIVVVAVVAAARGARVTVVVIVHAHALVQRGAVRSGFAVHRAVDPCVTSGNGRRARRAQREQGKQSEQPSQGRHRAGSPQAVRASDRGRALRNALVLPQPREAREVRAIARRPPPAASPRRCRRRGASIAVINPGPW
jgi:hypothetical protein